MTLSLPLHVPTLHAERLAEECRRAEHLGLIGKGNGGAKRIGTLRPRNRSKLPRPVVSESGDRYPSVTRAAASMGYTSAAPLSQMLAKGGVIRGERWFYEDEAPAEVLERAKRREMVTK